MPITAKLSHLRIAPRKVRLVADLIRGKSVGEALMILTFTVKRAAKPLLKLLKSAVANTHDQLKLEEKNLYISKITVDEGRKLKRWRPASKGSAHPILKRSSHITIVLDQLEKKITTKKEISTKEQKIAKIKKMSIPKPKFRKKADSPAGGQKPKAEKILKKTFKRKAF